MMKFFDNVIIENNIHTFCLDFSQNNKPSMTYADNVLEEYYPKTVVFAGNFNFEYICIGKIIKDVPSHIDEGRDSALIIPLDSITINTNSETYTTTIPFLLDTSKLHSASAKKDSLFLAIDFKKKYEEVLRYLIYFDKLSLKLL